MRQGLKSYSNWPSYPQLYVNGELIGGLDIVKVMLQPLLENVSHCLLMGIFYSCTCTIFLVVSNKYCTSVEIYDEQIRKFCYYFVIMVVFYVGATRVWRIKRDIDSVEESHVRLLLK